MLIAASSDPLAPGVVGIVGRYLDPWTSGRPSKRRAAAAALDMVEGEEAFHTNDRVARPPATPARRRRDRPSCRSLRGSAKSLTGIHRETASLRLLRERPPRPVRSFRPASTSTFGCTNPTATTCTQQDPHIEPDRPVLDIEQIVFHARVHQVDGRRLAAQPVHLGPAGDPRLDPVAVQVAIDAGRVILDVRDRVWPRPHGMSPRSIDELRQLVEAGARPGMRPDG